MTRVRDRNPTGRNRETGSGAKHESPTALAGTPTLSTHREHIIMADAIARMMAREAEHIAHLDSMIEDQAARFGWDAEQQDAERVVLGRTAAIAVNFRDFQALLEAARQPQPQLPSDDGLIKALEGIANAVRIGAETDVQAWANLAYACQHTAREALSRHKAPLSVAGDDVERILARAFGEPIHIGARDYLEKKLAGAFCRQPDMSGDQRKRLNSRELSAVKEIADKLITALQVTEGDRVERLREALNKARPFVQTMVTLGDLEPTAELTEIIARNKVILAEIDAALHSKQEGERQ